MSRSYNINIVAGSLPELNNGKLYNVSYLCRRDGTWDAGGAANWNTDAGADPSGNRTWPTLLGSFNPASFADASSMIYSTPFSRATL